jgi:3-oxoacyl-ACP reductase-like protein
MGLFNKILSKLGLGKDEETPKAPAAAAPAKPAVAAAPAKPAVVAAPAKTVAPAPAASSAAQSVNVAPGADQFAALKKEPVAPAVKAVSEVDVVKQLEQMTEGSGLDWKVSIVDLLKVLGIDSSLNARKELAEELGCPAELMGGDHSKMNIWLHKTVLKKIAENGGNIPANLLD